MRTDPGACCTCSMPANPLPYFTHNTHTHIPSCKQPHATSPQHTPKTGPTYADRGLYVGLCVCYRYTRGLGGICTMLRTAARQHREWLDTVTHLPSSTYSGSSSQQSIRQIPPPTHKQPPSVHKQHAHATTPPNLPRSNTSSGAAAGGAGSSHRIINQSCEMSS